MTWTEPCCTNKGGSVDFKENKRCWFGESIWFWCFGFVGIYFVMLETENNFCSRGLVKYFTAIFYCSFNIFCCIYCTTFDFFQPSAHLVQPARSLKMMGFLLSQLWFKDVKLWNDGKSCRILSHGHYWDVLRLFHLISASIR